MNLSSLTLLYPYALAAIPVAVAALVYAYRRRGVGPRQVVGTVLILKKLERKAAPRRLFKPPLRFFFELLLLLVLCAGIAGAALTSGGERIALIIDTSLSMQARDGSATSHWERALTVADRELERLSLLDEVEIWSTTPQFQRALPEALSPWEARKYLRTMHPAFGQDALESGIARVLQDPALARIVLLTDRSVSLPTPTDRISAPALDIPLSSANVAITSVIHEPEQSRLMVNLRSFSEQTTAGELLLDRWSSGSWTSISRVPCSIPADHSETFALQLPRALSDPLKVTFTPSPNTTLANALREDDSWWLVPNASRPIIEVVSPLPLSQLGLQQLSKFEFRAVSGTAPTSEVPRILHRQPAALPEAPALLVIRPQSSPDAVLRDVPVTRWSSAHPITSYVNLPSLRIPEAVRLSVAPVYQPIVSGPHGALISVQETARERVALVGFEVFPYEGKRSPASSILMLNLLKWLSGSSLHAGSLEIGEAVPGIAAESTVQPLDSLREGSDTVGAHNSTRVPGLYQHPSGVYAVNFFSADESNLLRSNPLQIPEHTPPVGEQDPDTGLYRILACAALVLLTLMALSFSAFRVSPRKEKIA